MATLQKTFKSCYVARLKDELRAHPSTLDYSYDSFEVDPTMVRQLANVYRPENLLDKMMNSQSEFEAAVALYEAYKNVSPLLASNETFWVYLTHTELFPYCQKRWPRVHEAEGAPSSYIIEHWFFGPNGMMRNTLASLWWSVYFSVDEERENPYELTEVLFRNYSFRVVWFSIFLRVKNGLLGILEFIKDNTHIFEKNFEMRGRFIGMYINRLGATRQLSYLPREFFYRECERIKEKIASIYTEKDLYRALGQG